MSTVDVTTRLVGPPSPAPSPAAGGTVVVLATAPPPPPPPSPDAPAEPEQLFFNREVSWLDFNQRVLELVQDPAVPLLERVRFLAIFSTNLDEFYMKRVGGLQRQRESNVSERSNDGLTPQEQLDAIHRRVEPLIQASIDTWFNDIHPALKAEGIQIRSYDVLDAAERAVVDAFFVRHVFPILTPLAVDPGHPFPHISNLSSSIGVLLENPADPAAEHAFVRVKVPENVSRWVPLPTKLNFVPLEQVIRANLALLFPGMRVIECQQFRVTRNADIELDEDDADDLLELVELELRRRRLARVVRLELPESMSVDMREWILSGLDVDLEDVHVIRGPLDMGDLFQIANLDLPKLKYKPWVPLVPPRLADQDADIFSVIRTGNLLVHHPYESFASSVERFIAAAVDDEKVLAIKMTLYRTSPESPFVPALIRAAEMGKQVAVLVELKARFDEQRNLELAQKLEKAGVHVVYGLVGLKTHTKTAMVVREEPDGLRTYVHIGTGNYNSKTAQLYTDLGLFTCDAQITNDIIELFHYLTGRSLKRDYKKLLVAPVNMRDQFLAKIRREADHARAGRPARIVAKMNALQDPRVIPALYDASRAGVRIDLIVRGFCCLRPQVPGMSENIRVVSILGRFLEHSRVFYFLNGGDEEYYIGSADWMYRNLDYRVEAIVPVEEPRLRERLRELLELMRTDRGHAWELRADGTWRRRPPLGEEPVVDSQEQLMALASRASRAVVDG